MSGLFVYSTGEMFPEQAHNLAGVESEHIDATLDSQSKLFNTVETKQTHVVAPRVIEQVDLAPTLALLMGHAVPYTSLGQIVPELFQETVEKFGTSSLSIAYRDNAEQVIDDEVKMHVFY